MLAKQAWLNQSFQPLIMAGQVEASSTAASIVPLAVAGGESTKKQRSDTPHDDAITAQRIVLHAGGVQRQRELLVGMEMPCLPESVGTVAFVPFGGF